MDKTRCNAYINTMEDALYIIGGKWKLRIIIALKEGHKRFNDIQRTVTGISAKVLSSELKSLEANDLISRNVLVDEFPVVVEYVLTDYSDSLGKCLTHSSNGELVTENGLLERQGSQNHAPHLLSFLTYRSIH